MKYIFIDVHSCTYADICTYILSFPVTPQPRTKMRRNSTRFVKLLVLAAVTILLTIFLYKTASIILGDPASQRTDDGSPDAAHPVWAVMERLRAAAINAHIPGGGNGPDDQPGAVGGDSDTGFFAPGARKNVDKARIDWHDYAYIAQERRRKGLGEHGVGAELGADREAERKEIFGQNGFNGLLSDEISVNRSVADIRHKGCAKVSYLKELPSVSVVVPFYNEHWSTLLRTCYSVLNRSPAHLIREIILVDDFSDKPFLKAKLDMYVAEHLPKVRIVRLPQRSGLIVARMEGAKLCTSDVLIFLDSHVEANTNWLPPLLEPIALNYRVCMCPFIDVIAYDTFQYRAQDEGARGAFDWQFYYKRLPLLPDDLKHPTRPFRSPVMAGGLFAISAKFFWELGGYDEGLDIWGGEQYELSFKIWQCGGEMYDAPCSRIGHIYRGPVAFKQSPRTTDYLHKNYKRVAEVWMDEYKEYLYARTPHTYANIDAGDISKQLAVRERLQCKSFKWFMEEVAFDLPAKYPPVEPPDFASGALQSVAHPAWCADTMGGRLGKPVGVFGCATDVREPQGSQFFALSWHKDVRLHGTTHCWDVPTQQKDAPVVFYDCHGQQGNQGWRYHLVSAVNVY